MTEINYVSDGKKCETKVEGKGKDVIKGFCRIASHVKQLLELDDNEFIKVLKGGMLLCELEDMVNDDSMTVEDMNKKMLEFEKSKKSKKNDEVISPPDTSTQ